jgi:hypothetical protein
VARLSFARVPIARFSTLEGDGRIIVSWLIEFGQRQYIVSLLHSVKKALPKFWVNLLAFVFVDIAIVVGP